MKLAPASGSRRKPPRSQGPQRGLCSLPGPLSGALSRAQTPRFGRRYHLDLIGTGRGQGREFEGSQLIQVPPPHSAAPCPARPQENTLEKARDKMGRYSSSEHLPKSTRGRMASPQRSASYLQDPKQVSYSLGVERAPRHGLQVLGQRRGEPAQRQHDHRHKPLAEPTLPRPGHLPGGRLHFGFSCRLLSKAGLSF